MKPTPHQQRKGIAVNESLVEKPGLNILILTQYFAPDGASWMPVAVSEEMKRRGHHVKVLTTFPHYTSGKISNGYRQKLKFTEIMNGVEVRRVPIFASHSRNPLGRIANYLSFVISARSARDFVRDADVIYVYGTPATVAEPARAWSKSLDIPFVYHVQDIWPESVTESGFLPRRLTNMLEQLINRWLTSVYSSAAAVIAIAPTATSMLVERGVPPDHAHVIYNWADGPGEVAHTKKQGLTLLYAGNLGHFQDVETVIRAAHRLSHLDDFRLRIAGGGVLEAQMRKLVSDLGATNAIEFLGRVNQDEMDPVYGSADFQIVPLKDVNIFTGTIPSKFQAGLAYGVPVVTTVKGDVSQLVNDNGLGFTALPENVDDLAKAFLAAYATTGAEREAMARRARQFYLENFTREIALNRIESILREVVVAKRSRDKK